MCKFKDIIKSGYEDFHAQKKRNRISFVLIMMSLLVFVGVNSAVNSIVKCANSTIYYPEARIAMCTYMEEDGDVLAQVKEFFKDDKRVKDVFKTADYTEMKWQNTQEYFGVDEVQVEIESFCTPILDYVDKNSIKELEYDEVLVPKYIYEFGKYDEHTYYDGKKLVGKTIELVYCDFGGKEIKTFEVKIVGTYDNIATRIGGDSIFVNQDFLEEVYMLSYGAELSNTEDFKQEMIEMGMDPDTYVVNLQRKVGIYISEKYDIDEVLSDIHNETGLYFSKSIAVSEETYGFYGYVAFVANLVSFMLLIIAFLNIVISSINEVKARKWEFALKLSMGYTYKDIISIFFVEKVVNMLKSFVVSLVIIAVFSGAATLILHKLLGRYGRILSFGLDVKYVALAIGLVIVAAFSGVISGRNSIKNIEVAEVLKSGD